MGTWLVVYLAYEKQEHFKHRFITQYTQEAKDFLICLNQTPPKFITLTSVLTDGSVIARTDDDARFVIPHFQKKDWQLTYYSH